MEAEPEPEDGSGLQNFSWMSAWFGIAHAVSTIPLVLASGLLAPGVGLEGNGIFYVSTVLGALLLSVPLVSRLGMLRGMEVGIALYVVYTSCFTIALFATSDVEKQRFFFFVGSCLGGIAASILWTAQGAYLTRCACIRACMVPLDGQGEDAARVRESRRLEENSSLAGVFATWYLFAEIVAKLGFSALAELKVSDGNICVAYTVVGALSLIMLARTAPIAEAKEKEAALNDDITVVARLVGVVKLWASPELWLLSFTNVTFGFSAAFMNGYFNSSRAVPILGKQSIAMLSAITVISATLLSRPYALLAASYGKGASISVGAASFATLAALVFFIRSLEGWGWRIAIFYVLMGSGRAVFESTNKAIFADFFPGDVSEAAFANSYVQMSAATAACFFLSDFPNTFQYLPICILVSAFLMPLGYTGAGQFRLGRKAINEGSPLLHDPIA